MLRQFKASWSIEIKASVTIVEMFSNPRSGRASLLRNHGRIRVEGYRNLCWKKQDVHCKAFLESLFEEVWCDPIPPKSPQTDLHFFGLNVWVKNKFDKVLRPVDGTERNAP